MRSRFLVELAVVAAALWEERPRARPASPRQRATTEGCTMATLFTPLSARYTLPSAVATMLRTTPPPEGIGVLENFFVRGSNLTNVFGSMPDSLNQTVPSGVTAIPYGLAPAPPGEGHSSTFREAGLNRPSWPRA